MGYLKGTPLIASCILFAILDTICVSVRLFIRQRTKTLGADDWLCIPALVLGLGMHAAMIAGVVLGVYGTRLRADRSKMYTAAGGDTPTLNKLTLLIYYLEPLSLACIKISILLFYRRIFIDQVVHWIIWILVGLVTLWGLGLPITMSIMCQPLIESNFNAPCTHSKPRDWAYIIVDTVLDFSILLIPIALISPMLISWQRKLSILCTLLVGGLVAGVSLLRLLVFTLAIHILPLDPLQNETIFNFLPVCQIGAGLILICLPILWPNIRRLCRLLFEHMFPSSTARSLEEVPSTPAVRQPRAKDIGQPTTLGSVNTQDLEAFARGRVRGDEEHPLAVLSGTSNEKSFGTVTTNSLP